MQQKNKVLIFLLVLLCNTPLYVSATTQQLIEHLRFLSERDALLARNISNVDTPNFRPYDLKKEVMPVDESFLLMRTSPKHMPIADETTVRLAKSEVLEEKPNGNGVNLEHELMKKSENASNLQQAANIYNKTRNMMKAAVVGIK